MPRCPRIIGFLSHVLCAGIFLVFAGSSALAAINPYATESATLTATIPEQSFNPPTLISPSNNSITNDPTTTFSWLRPSPLPTTPLDHYDFYLDGNLFASDISDNTTNTEYYFYYIRRDNDTFYLELKNNLDNGYHHWKVIAYNQTGLSSESETWTYYIDATPPHIKLITADKNILNWDSAHPENIPTVDQRYLYVTQNPLITGSVEPYANLQFTLLCPSGIPNCTSLTQTFSYSSGNWQNRFYNLIPNQTYTVYLTSTDSAGNTAALPPFYLIYLSGPAGSYITPTKTPTSQPTPTINPSGEPTINPPSPTETTVPITLPEILIPAEFTPLPPAAPLPPPEIITMTVEPKTFNYFPYLLLLLIIGLPLHLALSQFGTATQFKFTWYFLITLLFPFLTKKKYRTHPFTTILFYDPKNTYTTWQTVISDINGNYSIKNNPPVNFFIKCFAYKRFFKPVIIYSAQHEIICLYSLLQSRENTLQRLQSSSMRIRSFPLILSVLTSSVALFFIPSYFILIYLYLSLQAAYSEYYYPRFTK